MKYLLILIALSLSISSFSQEQIYTITKTDGTIIKAKYFSERTKFIKYTTLNDEDFDLPYREFNKVQYTYQKNKKSEIKQVTARFINFSKRNGMVMILLKEGKCSLYMYYTSQGGAHYCVIRENEQIATAIYLKQIISNNFKKTALKYFEDCPKILEKIKSKEFNKKNIQDMIDYYNDKCS